MPRKKLTKSQVKRKMKTCLNAMYDMLLDKMGHANSDVPFSMPKLMEFSIGGRHRRRPFTHI